MYYCPVCGRADNTYADKCTCEAPLEYEIDVSVPTDAEMAALLQQETARIASTHGVVAIRWATGYAIIDADALAKMTQAQVNKLFGGTPNEKRRNVRHR